MDWKFEKNMYPILDTRVVIKLEEFTIHWMSLVCRMMMEVTMWEMSK